MTGKEENNKSNDSLKLSPLHIGRGAGGEVDINCDTGEGIGNDELIMPYITSANIAWKLCGVQLNLPYSIMYL
jgi:LamB/YcsF family